MSLAFSDVYTLETFLLWMEEMLPLCARTAEIEGKNMCLRIQQATLNMS